jgi:Uma2 family endonuclease
MATAVSTAPTTRVAADPLWQFRRRFTVDDYYRMGESGLIGPDERTELLDGEVVHQMPINSRHAGCVKVLNEIFTSRLLGRAVVGVQDPVRLGAYSEPQPDISVLAPRADRYRGKHPRPADVHLLIEVADTSLALDRRVKVPLYAKAGIAEVWVVDLLHDAIEVYRDPTADGYGDVQRLARGQAVGPGAFGDLSIRVEEILGSE